MANAQESEYKIHSEKGIPWKYCKKADRIVIKLGTRALIENDLSFDETLFKNLAIDLSELQAMGKEIIIVSSGAVNAGVKELGLLKRPRELVSIQTMAAVGNPLLIEQYRQYFTFCHVGQILVTQEDLSNRESYNNFRNTMEDMLSRKIIPIINENDVVSVNEIRARKDMQLNFTDNDILAGLIAASLEADLLIILSDIEGLYTKHPNSSFAEFVPFVPKITEQVLDMAQSGTELGKGGMYSKVIAGQIATYSGVTMLIAHAKKTRVKDFFKSTPKCTFFAPKGEYLKRNKEIWLMFGANVKGKLIVDSGAANAIQEGASLLFNGILNFEGKFRKNDVIEIYERRVKPGNMKNKKEEKLVNLARAKTRYSSEELQRFEKLEKEERLEYFKEQNIREIVSHEHMAFIERE